MPVENKYQRDIVVSAILQGGHARKQSHRFSIGVPDLMIRMPGYTAIEVEVKRFESLMEGFERKIDITPKQLFELNRANAASVDGPVAFVFVVLRWRDKKKYTQIIALPPSVQSLHHAMIHRYPVASSGVGGKYDILTLLEQLNVPKTNGRRNPS